MAVLLPWLPLLLRVAGAGLIVLALAHIPMSRVLQWREDASRMSPAGTSIFHVHTLFVCITIAMMGLPALVEPTVFLVRTPAGAWITASFTAFWALRLYVQWFVFPAALWRGKPFETAMHLMFTGIWVALTALFATCLLVQLGRVG